METLAVAVAVELAVAVAVIVTPVAAPGAVNVEFAPLAVWEGVNDPQEPDGEQLQSTPALELSFETVAASKAVPPAFIVDGGAVAKVMEIAPGVPFDDLEAELTAPPQPEKPITTRRRIISATSVALKVLRMKSTGSSHDFDLSPFKMPAIAAPDPANYDEAKQYMRTIRGKPEQIRVYRVGKNLNKVVIQYT